MDELKKHIKETNDLADQYEKAGERLAISKEEFFDMKVDILGSAFGMLIKKMFDTVDEWANVNSEKIQQDKELSTTIKESIQDVITAISNQKAPNVQVRVDMQPMVNEISKQNETMIKLLNKLDNGKSDELQRLIIVMTQKQISFLEKGVQQYDYTKELKLISDAINKDDKVKELEVRYFDNGRIQKVIPIYKVSNK